MSPTRSSETASEFGRLQFCHHQLCPFGHGLGEKLPWLWWKPLEMPFLRSTGRVMFGEIAFLCLNHSDTQLWDENILISLHLRKPEGFLTENKHGDAGFKYSFHPYLGNIPILINMFSNGLKPPPRNEVAVALLQLNWTMFSEPCSLFQSTYVTTKLKHKLDTYIMCGFKFVGDP